MYNRYVLDENKLNYLWSERTELYYQVLQQIDTIEWRRFQAYQGAEVYYCCFISEKAWSISSDAPVNLETAIGNISNEILSKLRKKNITNLDAKEFRLFKREMFTRWGQIDDKTI